MQPEDENKDRDKAIRLACTTRLYMQFMTSECY